MLVETLNLTEGGDDRESFLFSKWVDYLIDDAASALASRKRSD